MPSSQILRAVAGLVLAGASASLVAGCGERPGPLAEQMKPKGIEKEFRPAAKPAATQVR